MPSILDIYFGKPTRRITVKSTAGKALCYPETQSASLSLSGLISQSIFSPQLQKRRQTEAQSGGSGTLKATGKPILRLCLFMSFYFFFSQEEVHISEDSMLLRCLFSQIDLRSHAIALNIPLCFNE